MATVKGILQPVACRVASGDVRPVSIEILADVHPVRDLATQWALACAHACVAILAHQMTTLGKHDRAWPVQAHATVRRKGGKPGAAYIGRTLRRMQLNSVPALAPGAHLVRAQVFGRARSARVPRECLAKGGCAVQHSGHVLHLARVPQDRLVEGDRIQQHPAHALHVARVPR